jgi:hypothetical protein
MMVVWFGSEKYYWTPYVVRRRVLTDSHTLKEVLLQKIESQKRVLVIMVSDFLAVLQSTPKFCMLRHQRE